MEHCHDDHMVPRSEEEISDLIKRLRRIEGQVRGIQKMVEEDRYCIDILTQIMAIEAVMKKVSFSLIERHANHCATTQKGLISHECKHSIHDEQFSFSVVQRLRCMNG